MTAYKLMGRPGSLATVLLILIFAGCDQGHRPLDAYGNGSPPPAPKIAIGEFTEYPAPGFPVNGRQLLLDALTGHLNEQGMLWDGDGNPRIDLTGTLQGYEGRYASPPEDVLVIDLSGELRDGNRVLVKSHVNRRVRSNSDWNVELGKMAEQLLDDLRAKITVPPSSTGIATSGGTSPYPLYGAGIYYPPSYSYDSYYPYYIDQPYYSGYYGPSYVNMYWLSYYWSGRHHHPIHDRDGQHNGPRPHPRPQPIPPGLSQSIPRTHLDDRGSIDHPTNRRPGNDSSPRSQAAERLPSQQNPEAEPAMDAQRPGFRTDPAILAVPRTSRPRDTGIPSITPQGTKWGETMRLSPPPRTFGPPSTQQPTYQAPAVMRPEPRPNSLEVPRRPTFGNPPTGLAPRTVAPSIRPPHVQSAPSMPSSPRSSPSTRGGGGFGGMVPGSQRRRR